MGVCVFWSEVQPKGKVALKVKEGVQWHGLGGWVGHTFHERYIVLVEQIIRRGSIETTLHEKPIVWTVNILHMHPSSIYLSCCYPILGRKTSSNEVPQKYMMPSKCSNNNPNIVEVALVECSNFESIDTSKCVGMVLKQKESFKYKKIFKLIWTKVNTITFW